MKKTEIMLLMRYEAPVVNLDVISGEYFGLSKNTAALRAKCGTLPVPAFKLGTSQKLPWLVKVEDLAAYIDKAAESAKKEWVQG